MAAADICLMIMRLTPEHDLPVKHRNQRLRRGDIRAAFIWEHGNGTVDPGNVNRRWFYSTIALPFERSMKGVWAVWDGTAYTPDFVISSPRLALQFCSNIVAGVDNAKVQRLLAPLLDPAIITDPSDPNFDPDNSDNVILHVEWKLDFSALPQPMANALRNPPYHNSASWTFMKSHIRRKIDHNTDGPTIEDDDISPSGATGGRRR